MTTAELELLSLSSADDKRRRRSIESTEWPQEEKQEEEIFRVPNKVVVYLKAGARSDMRVPP